jgi:hypothetical protein
MTSNSHMTSMMGSRQYEAPDGSPSLTGSSPHSAVRTQWQHSCKSSRTQSTNQEQDTAKRVTCINKCNPPKSLWLGATVTLVWGLHVAELGFTTRCLGFWPLYYVTSSKLWPVTLQSSQHSHKVPHKWFDTINTWIWIHILQCLRTFELDYNKESLSADVR